MSRVIELGVPTGMMSMQELFYGDRDPADAYLQVRDYGHQRQQLVPVIQEPDHAMAPLQHSYGTQSYRQISRPNIVKAYFVGSRHAARQIVTRAEGIATNAEVRSNNHRAATIRNDGIVSTFTRICCPGHSPAVQANTLVWHPWPVATVTVVEPVQKRKN